MGLLSALVAGQVQGPPREVCCHCDAPNGLVYSKAGPSHQDVLAGVAPSLPPVLGTDVHKGPVLPEELQSYMALPPPHTYTHPSQPPAPHP